jgi:hypothetical protein
MPGNEVQNARNPELAPPSLFSDIATALFEMGRNDF